MTGIPSPPNTPGLSLHLAHLNSTQSMERLRRTRKWNPNMIKAQPPPQPPEGPTDRQCSQRPHGPVQTTTDSTDAPMKVHTAGRSHKTPVSKSLQGGPHSRTTQTSFWWSGPAQSWKVKMVTWYTQLSVFFTSHVWLLHVELV